MSQLVTFRKTKELENLIKISLTAKIVESSK